MNFTTNQDRIPELTEKIYIGQITNPGTVAYDLEGRIVGLKSKELEQLVDYCEMAATILAKRLDKRLEDQFQGE